MTEDMLRAGLVASLSRPGGNTTGISLLSPDLDGKRQEILIEAVPGVRKMAALADSTVTPQRHLEALQDGARRRGVELSIFGVASSEQVVPAIEAAKAAGAQALNLLATPLFTVSVRGLIERIAALRLPAMHQWPEMAEDGGLLGYGPRFDRTFRSARAAGRSDTARRQACRHPGRAADPLRTGDQPIRSILDYVVSARGYGQIRQGLGTA